MMLKMVRVYLCARAERRAMKRRLHAANPSLAHMERRSWIVLFLLLIGLFMHGPARADEEVVTYYLTDEQGTVLETTDAQGGAAGIPQTYTPFGEGMLGRQSGRVGYAGHFHDDDINGLVYMQARYYDTHIGRFLSVDPVVGAPGQLADFNRYAYGRNNPHRYVDPDGRAPELLTDLKIIRKEISDKGNRVMVAATGMLLDRADKTEISASLSVPGATASKSVYGGSDSISIDTSGLRLGAEASVSVKSEIISLDFHPDRPASAHSYSLHLGAYEIVGGGIEVKYNYGGKFSMSLLVGTGEGGSVVSGQMNTDVGEQAITRPRGDQEIREIMGIDRETPGIF
ncbi:RHS repeat-associated core domain-containing protein [Luteibacter sp.]|jgi:RHS repeat-associated protein|uniref:RHS repeat domain-containing protein n=1 Tax=Luteibacter sp. TaxID=1886636 RepID=UPI002F402D1F